MCHTVLVCYALQMFVNYYIFKCYPSFIYKVEYFSHILMLRMKLTLQLALKTQYRHDSEFLLYAVSHWSWLKSVAIKNPRKQLVLLHRKAHLLALTFGFS